MLHNRLAQLRKSAKLKQEDIANKIGVARTTYAMYEQGKRNPDYDILNKIADYYEVSLDYLLGRTDQQNKDKPSGVSFDPLKELNKLFKKYDVRDAGFWDIEKWKEMGPDELRRMEEYFEFLYNKSKKNSDGDNGNDQVDDI